MNANFAFFWYNVSIDTQPLTSGTGRTIVVVGGGFGGVRCALDLAAAKRKDLRIVLITNRPDLEYYGALYKLIGGCPPGEVSVPLSLLFKRKRVEVIEDTIKTVDLQNKTLKGSLEKEYRYDDLILAPGAENATFGIPGIEEHALLFRSVKDALELKRHLHATLTNVTSLSPEEQRIASRFVVIGGGATGVEVASELAVQGKKILRKQGSDPSLIRVDLIEAMPRIMGMLPESMSQRIAKRLRRIGVTVHTDTAVQSLEDGVVHLKGEDMQAKTIVWTAGIKGPALFGSIAGMELDKRGRAVVDEQLRAKGQKDVYVLGDSAATQYSGMAQTAIEDATFVASVIVRQLKGKSLPSYKPVKPAVALPVGLNWAAVLYGPFKVYGVLGWLLRQAADIRAFLTILSPWKLLVFLRTRGKHR